MSDAFDFFQDKKCHIALSQEATNAMKFDVAFSPFNLLGLGEEGIQCWRSSSFRHLAPDWTSATFGFKQVARETSAPPPNTHSGHEEKTDRH
jgi:hypothetical protein